MAEMDVKIESPDDTPGIRWLASYPRSGNTWARMFLRAYMDPDGWKFNTRNPFVKSQHAEIDWHTVSAVPLRYLDFSSRLDYHTAVLRNMLYRANGEDVRLKTHDANVLCQDRYLIPRHITKHIVYIVRDPRDVAVSYGDYRGTSTDEAISAMAQETHCLTRPVPFAYGWFALTSWSTNVKSYFANFTDRPTTIVQYEKMLEDPEEAFEAIRIGMGVPDFGLERLRKAIDAVEFSRLQKMEDAEGMIEGEGKGERYFRSGRAGGWQDVLTEAQIAQIERDHGEVMEQVGYELSGVTV